MFATSSTKRLLVGVALAPLAPGVLMLAVSLLGNAGEGLWAFKLIALIAYPAMLVIGLPFHMLFQRIGWTSMWPYLIAGVLSGMVAAYLVFPTLHLSGAGRVDASSIAITAVSAFLGAITAAAFWLIVRPEHCKGD